MKIALGCDHAGFALKQALKRHLQQAYEVLDIGCHSAERADYPDYGIAAAQKVADGACEMGVLVCGSGIGISIAANKVKGVRAALACDVERAKLARQHNDANMVAIGARFTNEVQAKAIVEAFLATGFEGGRHQGRVEKILKYEESEAK